MRFSALAFSVPSLLSLATAHPSFLPDINSTTTCTRSLPDFTNCSPSASSDDKQCPHAYTFSEYAPGTYLNHDSNRQPYFRFMILFKMNPDLCEEQANEHWKTVHADLTLAMKGTGVLIERYVQFHADQASRVAIQSLEDTGSVEVAPYDGIAEFHAKDAESVLKFINNAFGDPVIGKDQEYFVDGAMKLQVMAGYDTLIYGSGIRTSGGTDGILPGDPRFNNGH
ncbi:uncharacterized protein CC84DRAFT_1132697 [Paraphaeosphaeria sporulosa]|uniref:EthD domain-containing protein n=1 Tax=Paraphaeosphaeria sporulosa TaxID=1460663 RepID=A0A177CVV2_9PLEO|nr:uncharacterized protein CC84DRAFT_1132697 [Paraphaeosphaeria sporulosa]OAG11158.1 hypothetical protein CC84DRAFT_1132697 [Paraphaeosphaeria sporulosa]